MNMHYFLFIYFLNKQDSNLKKTTSLLTCESNTLLALFLFADCSLSLLLEPLGLCMYTSPCTATRAESINKTNLMLSLDFSYLIVNFTLEMQNTEHLMRKDEPCSCWMRHQNYFYLCKGRTIWYPGGMEIFWKKKQLHSPLKLKKKKGKLTNLRSKKKLCCQRQQTKKFNLTPKSSREKLMFEEKNFTHQWD